MLSLFEVAASPEFNAEVSFRASYEDHFRAVARYVARLSGDRHHAEDVAQEVFVRLWKELITVGEPPNPRAWLLKVASNLVVSHFRRRTRALRFLLPVAASSNRARAHDHVEKDAARRQIVERVLKRLPEPMRRCLLLHQEGLTGREIAEILGVKPSYVATLVFRAHERFRRECDALGGHDGLFG